MKKLGFAALTASIVAIVAACSSNAAEAPKVCSGTSCSCTQGATCAFDTCSASTPGCSFACAPDASCTGTCGDNCNVACNGKSCTHTVGAGSTVACNSGTCAITCNGPCTVTGTSTLTCNGGTTKGVLGCS